MEAIILAGGFGTRLKSVVNNVPKPMAPINDIPFLKIILDKLSEYNFKKIILAVGYKNEIIIEYFKYKYKNIEIIYSIEDKPLGTGGCIKQALKYVTDDYCFVINGDTYFNIDYAKMYNGHSNSIACKKLYKFNRYGMLTIKNDKIISFNEKKYVEEGYINGGIYLIKKNIFDNYKTLDTFSFEKDFLEKHTITLSLKPFISDGYFIDIGIPSDYYIAQNYFKKNKALFLDRDGIINIDYGHVYKPTDFKFTSFIFDFLKHYQENNYLLIVITNQAGIAKGLYTEQQFNIINNYMLSSLRKRNIEITHVYFCPHKDEDNCECRKPKSGLFFKAINDYNINPYESVAIGDKITDLIAAHNAGIKKLILKKSDYKIENVNFEYDIIK